MRTSARCGPTVRGPPRGSPASSSADVMAARACAPSRAEPVSSRTDSGSVARGDVRGGGLDQQGALAGARAADHPHHAAHSRFGERGRRQIGVRCGHVGMTPRGSDKSTATCLLAASHSRVATVCTCTATAQPGRPSVLAIHGLTGHGQRWQTLAHAAPARCHDRRTGSARPRPVVVGGAVDARRQRRGTCRACSTATARSWSSGIRSAARSR